MEAETPQARLLTAFDLHEVGVEMMRARVRRENPRWSEDDVRARVEAWLRHRPGAEFGDCPGRPVTRAWMVGRA